jgi:small-conductance mechanosensitive channel
MRLASKRSGLGAAWLAGLLLGAAVPALWAERVAAQTPPAPSADTPAPAEGPPPIEAIPLPKVAAEAEKTNSRLREIRVGLGESPAFSALEEAVPEVDRETAALAIDTAKTVEAVPQLRTLNKLEAQWRGATESLPQWESRLADRATKLGKWSKELDVLLETWQKTRTEARKAKAPDEVIGRVGEGIAQIEDTEKLLAVRLKRVLALQNQVGEQRQRLADGLAIIQKGRAETVTTLFAADRSPVWSQEFRDDLRRELAEGLSGSFEVEAKTLVDYLEEHPERLPLQGAFFAITSFGLVAWRRRMRQRPEDDELRTGSLAQIFELPFSAALLLALLLGRLLYATQPPVFSNLVVAVALFPSVLILRRFLHPNLYLLLYATVVFYLVGLVSDLSDALPTLERVILMIQTLAGVALLGWLLRPARLGRIPPELAQEPMLRVLSAGVRVAFIGFAVAFLAAALGFERLAELVGDGVLKSAYFALVIIALVHVGQSLAILVLRVRPLSLLGMVRRHRLLFQRRIQWLMQLGGFIWWGWLALDNFAVRRSLFGAVGAAFGAELVMGSVRLSLGGLLGFAVTIWVAFTLSRFLRFVLEEDVYPRARLSRGRPYAVSTMVHYTILFVGFLLAVAATGLSMDRVTIMLGAFGVGIGFGLQNIVNNFVSGLILLFERPIHIGDAVQVGSLWGEVRRIGIRASVVRTFDGAEVIVPNGQLISEQVTNWTLSDRTRRLILRIGVEYGTDPERVLEILRSLAQEHPEVLETPEPLVLFIGHGDSSLDFELRAWTRDFNRGLTVSSELTVAINRALAEAGITVPFPQRDLHVRSADPELQALVREGAGEADPPRPAPRRQ